MKILATNDIHQMANKWKLLVKETEKHRPDVVAIAGDLLPKTTGIPGQMGWKEHLEKYCDQIIATGAELVLTLGNDDNIHWIVELMSWDKPGFHYLQDGFCEVKGQQFAGMPSVPDYPFSYKVWCAPEFSDHLKICKVQFGEPCTINEHNQYEDIPSFEAYMSIKKSIWDRLAEMFLSSRSDTIWLIHAPPANMGLDVCANGQRVGSLAVLKFIEESHLMLTIHGHIHESPECNKGKWYEHYKNTICVQGGQTGKKLCYSLIEVDDGKVISMEHSIYGEGDVCKQK